MKTWFAVAVLVLLGIIALGTLKQDCTGFVGADGTSTATCRSWVSP